MITWTRITKERAAPVRLQHADHIGTRDGAEVAFITRRLDGRWVLWLPETTGWAEVGNLRSLVQLKGLAETAPAPRMAVAA